MWILNRSQIALHRADLMFGSIAEDGSLGMGSIRFIHLYGKLYRRIFFTIDYEGVIVISIRLSRRELARELLPITFQS